MRATPESTVGEVAAARPATIRVFQRHGVDFCCGGGRTIAEVSAAHGIGIEQLLAELGEAAPGAETAVASRPGAPIAEAASHILARYHAWLWRELPRLGAMCDKVLRAHGERHPESVPEMHRLFGVLRGELEPHMIEEEDVVFPALVAEEMRRSSGRPEGLATRLPAGVEGVAILERQHEAVGQLLRDLRRVTGGYTPPEDACNTFRGFLHGLAELEGEVHEHVHLENNVLFPVAARLRATAPAPRG